MQSSASWQAMAANNSNEKGNTMNTTKTTTIEQQIKPMVREWTALLKALKADISDDYRASDDPGDSVPGMQVTIGFTPAGYGSEGREHLAEREASWGYQTGDNSYTGGAYCHPHWAVVSLYRRSNCRELAEDCASQIAELAWQ